MFRFLQVLCAVVLVTFSTISAFAIDDQTQRAVQPIEFVSLDVVKEAGLCGASLSSFQIGLDAPQPPKEKTRKLVQSQWTQCGYGVRCHARAQRCCHGNGTAWCVSRSGHC